MTKLPSKPMGFDFDDALKSLQAGQPLSGKGGILTPLIKQLTEAALAAELEAHIDSEPFGNRKNGTTSKTIKSRGGPINSDHVLR